MRGLEAFLQTSYVDVLDVTRATADRFSRLATFLRRAGTPIPTNDIWIAAHTIESSCELLTFDKHFTLIPDLTVIDPSRS